MNKQIEDIKAIREMMEKSSKFLSLSGLSGVLAGITAIAGAAFAYFYLLRDPSLTDYNRSQELGILFADAMAVLLISVGFGIHFSRKKAKKNGQKLFSSLTWRTLYSLGIPLLTGGIFSLIFLLRGDIQLVISATLIFYGLALFNVSKYTYREVQYLGLTVIVLGLIAAVFMQHGLLFWTIGFGVCHIIYGLAMYYKYDRKNE
jgi:predicted lysophospholipase L1 biosynthesis ABC-type transport system permease subunit